MGFKKFMDQDYSKLHRKHKNSSTLFVDTKFPPKTSSLFAKNPPPGHERIKWVRASELHKDARMFVDGADSRDVRQGALGNCWFVAAAAGLASHKKFLHHVVPKDQYFVKDYGGIFHFRFWEFGEWIEVVVDDYLPTVNGRLIYVYSEAQNEFWPALLEKAYAKLNGCYENLEAGNPADAMVNFTSGVCEDIDLRGPCATIGEPRKNLFRMLQKCESREALMSASITAAHRDEFEKKLACGLVVGHAYAVTNVLVIHKLPMVRLRNPWGKGEWTGPWSDCSKEWNSLSKREKKKAGLVQEEDGEFWMTLDDFCTYFTSLTICRLINLSFFHLSKVWFLSSFFGRWQGHTAGGCANYKSFLDNPQYIMDHTTDGDLMVSLTQTDVRALRYKGVKNKTIGFQVFRVADNREHRLCNMQPAAASSQYINNREVFGRFKLPAGRYIVVPSTFEPNEETGFMLRVFTDRPTHVKRVRTTVPKLSCWHKFGCSTYPRAVISVTAVSANGLPKQDVVGGADPFVEFTCEGKTSKTPTIHRTLEPQWDSAHIFYIKDPRTAVVRVVVTNWNVVRNQFMGMVTVNVAEFITAERSNSSYKLTKQLLDKSGKPTDGKIVLMVMANTSLRI